MIIPFNPNIKRYLESVEGIFFQNSNKTFVTEAEKNDFKIKWLSPYFEYLDLFFVKIIDDKVAGYINGSISTNDIPSEFKVHLSKYPAHLHINICDTYQGQGVGTDLVRHFLQRLNQLNIKGVHIITSANSRNVSFYQRNGFANSYHSHSGKLLLMGNAISEK